MYHQRRSSCPVHLTGWNGLNFVNSIGNPLSNLERVRTYLRSRGPMSKRDILWDVFQKTLDNTPIMYESEYVARKRFGVVSSGWNATFFALAVRHGFLTKVRKGNVTYWSVN